jgi:hypothetical protein
MNKVKLSLLEVLGLDVELKGITNQGTLEKLQKGLLDEKLKISVKYHLSSLSDKLSIEIERIEKFKEELIKALGTTDENGNISIPYRINEKFNEEGTLESWEINPKFIEFNKDVNELLKEEIEIEFNSISIDDLDVETEIYPKILFKIINQ